MTLLLLVVVVVVVMMVLMGWGMKLVVLMHHTAVSTAGPPAQTLYERRKEAVAACAPALKLSPARSSRFRTVLAFLISGLLVAPDPLPSDLQCVSRIMRSVRIPRPSN